MAQQKQIQLGTMRWRVRSLASLSGLRIRCCHELGCRSQVQLGSRVAVALAQAGGYSSDSTPRLGTSICRGYGPKKTKQKTNLWIKWGKGRVYEVCKQMEETSKNK